MANPYQSPQADSQPVEATPPWLCCPRCGEQALTARKKSGLLPRQSAECDACGGSVCITWRDFLYHSFAPVGVGWALGSVPLAAWLALLFWLSKASGPGPSPLWIEWQLQWSQTVTVAAILCQFAGLAVGFYWSQRALVRKARLISK